MYWLGIDPGQSGASLLLSPDGRPVFLWAWRPRINYGAAFFECFYLHMRGENRKVAAPTLGRVGWEIQQSLVGERIRGFGLAVEAPYISRINPSVGLTVAIQTGAIAGPLEEHSSGSMIMVKAEEWRRSLLDMKITTKRDAAKEASLSRMPPRIPGLITLLERLASLQGATIQTLDHVTDSAGVAEYGLLRRWEQRDADRKSKRRSRRKESI